jgi:hypothetical protein
MVFIENSKKNTKNGHCCAFVVRKVVEISSFFCYLSCLHQDSTVGEIST